MSLPDCLGLNINDARKLLFDFDKNIGILFRETHSFKDDDVKSIELATVIQQREVNGIIELTIAFF